MGAFKRDKQQTRHIIDNEFVVIIGGVKLFPFISMNWAVWVWFGFLIVDGAIVAVSPHPFSSLPIIRFRHLAIAFFGASTTKVFPALPCHFFNSSDQILVPHKLENNQKGQYCSWSLRSEKKPVWFCQTVSRPG